MFTQATRPSFLFVIGLAALVACASETRQDERRASEATTTELELDAANDIDVNEASTRLEGELVQLGYVAYRGQASAFRNEQCPVMVSVFADCFGNNPAAPYILIEAPALPGEYIDPYYGHVTNTDADGNSYRFIRRFRADEGQVVILRMPSRAAYFGYQSYIFSRNGKPKSSPVLPSAASPNPNRTEVFNSLSNAINNVVMEKQLGSEPWGKLVVLATSMDQRFKTAIIKAMTQAGFSANQLYFEAIGKRAKAGLTQTSDDFTSLIRYALPENETAGESWRNELPIVVLRVTTTGNESSSVRLADEPLTTRAATSESALAKSRDALMAEIRKRLAIGKSVKTANFISSTVAGIDTYKCIDSGTNCLGDTRDTDSYRIGTATIIGKKDVLVLVGINHTQTGNASYVSLAVNDADEKRGVASVSQVGAASKFTVIPQTLNGSAERVLKAIGNKTVPTTLKDLSKLYVRLLARDCTGLPDCTVIPTDRWTGVTLERNVAVMQRAYIRPGGTRGADPSKLQSPQQVLWQRP